MMVIMNNIGQFARASLVDSHGGARHSLCWGSLNNATIFRENIKEREYKGIFSELMSGIFVKAEETRTVTLIKDKN